MKHTQSKIWCLYNLDTEVQITGLTTREVQAIATAVGESGQRMLFIWTPEMTKWQKVFDIKDLLNFEGLNVPNLEPPSRPNTNESFAAKDDHSLKSLVERSKADEQSFSDLQEEMVENILDLSIQTDEANNSRREYQRYERKFRVQLEKDGKNFESFTRNISVGGMLLSDHVPKWIFGYFTAKIYDPLSKDFLVHTCWVVEEEDSKRRFHVAFLPFKKRETSVVFENWIKSVA